MKVTIEHDDGTKEVLEGVVSEYSREVEYVSAQEMGGWETICRTGLGFVSLGIRYRNGPVDILDNGKETR